MKKLLSGLLILSFIFSFVLQNLDFNVADAQIAGQAPCVNLSYNMTIGSRDYNTEGEVTQLQIFLNSIGAMNYPPTGYFGVLTRAAVANYQTAHNIFPNVGYFGPITRASINSDTCNNHVPSNPISDPSYYCSVNGISYLNENDYKNNCVSTVYYYVCSTTGQTYDSQAQYNTYCPTNNNPVPTPTTYLCQYNNIVYYDINSYNANCKSPNTYTYYCSLNNQTYYNLNDFNNNCKSNNTLPICNLNTTYSTTNSCACPATYTFMNVSNGYRCDNSNNYACTMIYVPPYGTSSTYDRCHYPYYCTYDNLYHNDASYCKPIPPTPPTTNNNICYLNTEYQGGGFVATNDCTCPYGSTRVDLGNFGEIYKWKCVNNYTY